jgi:prepilin-type N-terminal cleavage/methylation domain-containing protein
MLRATRDRRFFRWTKGFSLLEVLVSTAIFSFVLASMYLLYTAMLGTMNRGEMFSDLQQNARVGLQRMVQEVRMAGYDPSHAVPLLLPEPRDFIRAADSGCLSFIGYQLDPHNPSAELTYQISYLLVRTTLRRLAEPWDSSKLKFGEGGGAQPLAENVVALTLTYYDMDNREIVPGDWASTHRCPPPPPPPTVTPTATLKQLTYFQLAQVRRIGISVRMRDVRPRTSPELYTVNTYVSLRNR